MSLFERIKNIRYDLQEKRKFPGDESGAYKRAKTDIETKNLIKKAGGSGDIGFTAPGRKEKVLKRTTRAIKQGTPDPFEVDTSKAAKQTAKDFGTPTTKSQIKKLSKKPGGYSAPKGEFGPGITKGQANVKGMERRSFKITKPSDVKLPQTFTDFSKKLRRLKSDVQDFKDKDIATMRTGKSSSKVKVSGGKNLSRQDVGMAPPDTPKKTKPQKSASAIETTKKYNQIRAEKASKNTMSSGKDFITKNRKQAETATTNLRKQVDKIAKNPKLTGSQKASQSRLVMKDVKTAQNFARGYANPKTAQTAITVPKDIKTVQSAAKSAIKPSSKSVSNIMKQNTIRVGPTGRVKTKGPQLLDDIKVKNVPREIRFAKTSQKVLAKTPKAIKPIARPALKLLAKAGTPGRIAAAGLGVALMSPAGRKALGQLATGVGLTALFGRGKKDKKLKVGDGLKNVGKVRVTADSKGLKRNQADMAKIKTVQKNFIDKYNKGRVFNKIKYNVNKQGTYDVIKPKKK